MDDDNEATYCRACGEEIDWGTEYCTDNEECAPPRAGDGGLSYVRNAHISVGGEHE